MKNAHFISFQCFKISVILKKTEKMQNKKFQCFRSNSLKKIFSFSVLFFQFQRNISEFFSPFYHTQIYWNTNLHR